jgi:K+-sensing histidine kinase KdpD
MHCLLELACKFSVPGQPVRVELYPEEAAVTLRLQITAKPLKPEHLERFFDVLAIGKTLAAGGDLGLSPALAAQIIQLCNGGRVTIANLAAGGLEIAAQLMRSGGDSTPAPLLPPAV